MTRPVALLCAALGVMGCGRPLATTSVSPSQLEPPDAFQCAIQQFDQLGFERTMYDQRDLRTSARKANPTVTFPDVQFRRAWDQLDVQVRPGASGTELRVTASTIAEYFGHTGPRYVQLAAGDDAKGAAQTLERACLTTATS